jgi:hypothetical protein
VRDPLGGLDRLSSGEAASGDEVVFGGKGGRQRNGGCGGGSGAEEALEGDDGRGVRRREAGWGAEDQQECASSEVLESHGNAAAPAGGGRLNSREVFELRCEKEKQKLFFLFGQCKSFY